MTTLIQTSDLGQGWFANTYADGSATIRNPDQGQRINLTSDEVVRLREMLALVPSIRNEIVEIDGRRWKIREAISMEAARDAINMARATGSVGSRHLRDQTACGGTKFVEADVVALNDDGTERQPGR